MKDDLTRRLEELTKPDPVMPLHQSRLRLVYMNSRTAARWGVMLVLLPTAFIGYNVSKYILGMAFLPDLTDVLPNLVLNDLLPLALLGTGLLAFFLNVLAVLHVGLERHSYAWDLTIQIKKKPANLAVMAVGAAGLIILLAYAIAENL